MPFKHLHRLLDPEESGGAATLDRGDDWTPTGPDAPQDAARNAPESSALTQEEKDEAEEALEAAKTASKAPKAAPEGEGGEAADDKPKVKDSRLPVSRHTAILNAERERHAAERERLEAELAQYKQGSKVADINAEIGEAEKTLTALETAYTKQVADGDIDKAAATMAQIRRTERSINEKSAQMREEAAEARAVERVRYDVTVERIEEKFPELNPDHESYDKNKTAEVMELTSAFKLKGYPPSAALQKAVKYVMPVTTTAQEKALETTARVDPKDVAAERKAAAAAKTAAAVAATPPNAAAVGMNSDKAGGSIAAKDIMKMSYDDFAKLDETTLARMRGDLV